MFRWFSLFGCAGLLFLGIQNLEARPLFGVIQEDKAAHASFAAAAQVGCSAIATTMIEKTAGTLGCFLMVNALGAIKEATDPMNHGTRDINDIYANFFGSGISFIAIQANF